MGEKTYLIVHQLKTYAMIVFQKIKRHVSRYIHRSWVVFITSQVYGISARYVQFSLFSNRSWIKRRLHIEIMTKRRIILSIHRQNTQQQDV